MLTTSPESDGPGTLAVNFIIALVGILSVQKLIALPECERAALTTFRGNLRPAALNVMKSRCFARFWQESQLLSDPLHRFNAEGNVLA